MASARVKKMSEDETITRGTTNALADLGFADAEERQTKLRLAHAISTILEKEASRAGGGGHDPRDQPAEGVGPDPLQARRLLRRAAHAVPDEPTIRTAQVPPWLALDAPPRHRGAMKFVLRVSAEGTIRLPAELLRILGVEKGGQLLAAATSAGLLLRPVEHRPVENYDDQWIREFDAAEAELAIVLKNGPNPKH